MNTKEHIFNSLSSLSKNPSSRLLIKTQKYWFVIHNFENPTKVICETLSNQLLNTADKLPSDTLTYLSNAGYTARKGRRTLGKMTTISTKEQRLHLAEEILSLMSLVFQIEASEIECDFQIDVQSHIHNKKLIETIKTLSKVRTDRSRFDMYHALLAANLLLLTDKKDTPLVVSHLIELPCYAVFSDDKSTRQYQPQGITYRLINGFDLFPLLQQLNAGSLLLNPRGDYGGELYKNEIEMICDAIPKIQKQNL